MAKHTGFRPPWKVALKWFLLLLLIGFVVGIVLSYTILPEHLSDEERGRWVGQWLLFPALLGGLIGYFVQEGRNRQAAKSQKVVRHTKTAPNDVFKPDR